jgi:hypothetical protein
VYLAWIEVTGMVTRHAREGNMVTGHISSNQTWLPITESAETQPQITDMNKYNMVTFHKCEEETWYVTFNELEGNMFT